MHTTDSAEKMGYDRLHANAPDIVVCTSRAVRRVCDRQYGDCTAAGSSPAIACSRSMVRIGTQQRLLRPRDRRPCRLRAARTDARLRTGGARIRACIRRAVYTTAPRRPYHLRESHASPLTCGTHTQHTHTIHCTRAMRPRICSCVTRKTNLLSKAESQ